MSATEMLEGSTLLDFAGIAPLPFPAYPVIQHLAEKLHAYTLPRAALNTRVKDLVDLVILAGMEAVEATRCVPVSRQPSPPEAWAVPFAQLAHDSPLAPSTTLHEGFARVVAFWQPVLAGQVANCRWSPDASAWVDESEPKGPGVQLPS